MIARCVFAGKTRMSKVRRLVVSTALLLPLAWHGALLQAAEETQQKTARLVSNPVGGTEILDMFSALVLVLAVIGAIAWLFKKYGNAAVFSKGPVQIVGGVSLGAREKAVLLQVEGERLLVGVAAGSVRTLHVLKPVEQNPEQQVETDTLTSQPESFADKLRRNLQRGDST